LHHVARILLVPRQAARQGEGVDEGAAHQLVERSSVTPLGGPDQLGLFHWLPFRGGSALTCPPAERLRRARRAGPAFVGDSLASLLVHRVAAVPAAVLLHLDPLAVVHLALHGDVVPPLAVLAR